MAWGQAFLEFQKKFHFFILGCFSRDSIGPIVKIDGTMDGAKYKAILEGHMLPFATNTMAIDWKMFQDNDSKHRCSLMIGKLKKLPDGILHEG